jgi:hypothetical protein
MTKAEAKLREVDQAILDEASPLTQRFLLEAQYRKEKGALTFVDSLIIKFASAQTIKLLLEAAFRRSSVRDEESSQ